MSQACHGRVAISFVRKHDRISLSSSKLLTPCSTDVRHSRTWNLTSHLLSPHAVPFHYSARAPALIPIWGSRARTRQTGGGRQKAGCGAQAGGRLAVEFSGPTETGFLSPCPSHRTGRSAREGRGASLGPARLIRQRETRDSCRGRWGSKE